MSAGLPFATVHNGGAIRRDAVPSLSGDEFREVVTGASARRERVVALFGHPTAAGPIELSAVMAADGRGLLHLCRTVLDNDRFASMTPGLPQVHLFEPCLSGCHTSRAQAPLASARSTRSARHRGGHGADVRGGLAARMLAPLGLLAALFGRRLVRPPPSSRVCSPPGRSAKVRQPDKHGWSRWSYGRTVSRASS